MQQSNVRKCIVNGQLAGFHMWFERSQIIAPSPMVGGHGGGIVKDTFAIVEFEDGTVKECYPRDIRFIDGFGSCKYEMKIDTEGNNNGRK